MLTRQTKRHSSWAKNACSALMILALASCQAPGSGDNGSGNGEACEVPFTKTIHAKSIQGHRHLQFDMKELFGVFFDKNTKIDDIDIVVQMTGKYKGEPTEIEVDVNGTQASEPGDERAYKVRKYDSSRDESYCSFKANKMKLNGAEPIKWAITRMLLHKGLFQVNLKVRKDHGPSKITAAWIEITGTKKSSDCSNPSPTPAPSATPIATPTPAPTATPFPAPQTQIDAVDPTGASVASSSMSISFSSNQPGSNFQCSVDNGAYSACSSPVLLSNLSNGSHSFHVYAINTSGVEDPNGAQYSWSVDTVAPSVDLGDLSGVPSLTNSTSISLPFSASGASGYRCSLDGATYVDCTSPVSYSGLTEGSHTISIVAVDSLGNVSENPATFQWMIDLTGPTTHLVDVSPTSNYSSSTSASFSFGANESATFECNLDNAGYASCESPVSFNNLSDGAHTFQVRGIDVVGNVGVSAGYAWTVDTQVPVLTLGEVMPAQGFTNAINVSVAFTASEVAVFRCSLDGAAWEECQSPFAQPILGEGPHEVHVVATDRAGNVSNTAVVAWVMDYSLPQIAWGQMLPSSSSHINSADFQAEVTSTEAVSLSCSLNGSNLGQNASPVQLFGLAEGVYSLDVVGTDSVGNLGNALNHAFTVDMTAPVTSLNASVAGLTRENMNTFTFSANEDASFQCSQDGAGFAACSSPMTISGLADGNHEFQVIATDLAGNASEVASVQWTVDTTPAVTTIVATRTTNAAISFSFSANESIQGYECSLDGAAYSNCSSPVSYSALSAGNHVFNVRSTDLAGNVEVPVAYSWTVDPAVTTSFTTIDINIGSASFGFTSNVSNPVFVCSLDGAAAMPCTSPVSYTGLANGAHSFFVQAVDSWGTPDPVGATYNWTVDTIAPTVPTMSISVTRASMTVNWTTNEPATSRVMYGTGSNTNLSTAETSSYVTSHSVLITGLLPNTVYSAIATGKDAAGNTYQSTRRQVRTSP